MTTSAFKGTDSQQELAAEIYQLMTTQASLFADDAPIRQTLSNLAEFLAVQSKRDQNDVAKEIDAALQTNDFIFGRQEQDGEVMYVTSRLGIYTPRDTTDVHTFKQRLYEPEEPLPIDDISVVVSTSRPAITTVDPVFVSDYWQVQAGLAPAPLGEDIDDSEFAPGVSVPLVNPEANAEAETVLAESAELLEATSAVAQTTEVPAEVVAEPVEAAEVANVAAAVEPVEAAEVVVATEPEEVVAAVEEQPVVAAKPAIFTLADGTEVDLATSVSDMMATNGDALERALLERLNQDPLRRTVSFGQRIYPEASLASLGKNDMRRIRDYIVESGEPMPDTSIIADIYYHNQRQADYEGFRFSLNYRLNREKDFEFVGVEGANLWSAKGLPAIGSKRIKAGDMAQIMSYLNEGYDDSLETQSVEEIQELGSVSRLLTFFEWSQGVLPYDASIAALIAPPVLPDQRTAVLRFDSVQQYTNHLVELRYPTGSRGGWLQGLEGFFKEHLVAGTLYTITRTDDPSIFNISYEEVPETDVRALTIDEKKNRFTFADFVYYTKVDEDWLLTQQRYGRLKNLKSFSLNERRKADLMLTHVFEVIGEQVGTRDEPRLMATFDDLLVSLTALRPISRSYLQALLDADNAYTADESTPGAYYYTPDQEEAEETAIEEDEADVYATAYEDDE